MYEQMFHFLIHKKRSMYRCFLLVANSPYRHDFRRRRHMSIGIYDALYDKLYNETRRAVSTVSVLRANERWTVNVSESAVNRCETVREATSPRSIERSSMPKLRVYTAHWLVWLTGSNCQMRWSLSRDVGWCRVIRWIAQSSYFGLTSTPAKTSRRPR